MLIVFLTDNENARLSGTNCHGGHLFLNSPESAMPKVSHELANHDPVRQNTVAHNESRFNTINLRRK